MAKKNAAPVAETESRPSIRFVAKLRQYEHGVVWRWKNGDKTTIPHNAEGVLAPTLEDEQALLERIRTDAFCGICPVEEREMPAEQRRAEGKVAALEAENAAQAAELEALRQRIRELEPQG